jgi:WD40 repeat protein
MESFAYVLGKWMPRTYDNRAAKMVAMCLFEQKPQKPTKPTKPTKRKFVQVEYAGSGIRLPDLDLSTKRSVQDIQAQFLSAQLFVNHEGTRFKSMDQVESTNVLVVCPHANFQGKRINTLTGHTNHVMSMAWSMSGRLASGSWDNTIKIWKDQDLVYTLRGHTNVVSSVAWSMSGLLASGSADKTIKVWKNEELCYTLRGHADYVRSVAWSMSGLLTSGSYDTSIMIWKDQDLLYTLTGHTQLVSSVAWSMSGLLASGSDDKSIMIWK